MERAGERMQKENNTNANYVEKAGPKTRMRRKELENIKQNQQSNKNKR